MKNNNLYISIIIPTYNRANLLPFTLNSVIAQSFLDWECLIIDDYSTDGTKAIVENYRLKDTRIKYVLNSRKKGAQGARNTGLEVASGDFIQFFDSDDIMYPALLESLFRQIEKTGADIATCFSRVLNESNIQINEFAWINEGNISKGIFTGQNYVDYNSALIKRDVIRKIGLTDESCPSFQEWDTHIRLSQIAIYTTIPKHLIDYYQRTKSTISSNDYKNVEGYLYIFQKYSKHFLKNIPSFQKQGAKAIEFAKKTNDIVFIQDTYNLLCNIIPNFSSFIKQNSYLSKKMIVENVKKIFHRLLLLFKSIIKRKSGNYISCEETKLAAKKQGLSILEYIEKLWGQEGNSEKVIDQLALFNFFNQNAVLIEIGGGTGRYIEHIVKKFNINRIYSYETAEDWSYYLVETYSPLLIRRESDGFNLKFEGDSTIDNIVAHGVFVYLPILHSFHYFKEMIRVIKNKGLIAFDIYASENFNLAIIETWLKKGEHYYPVVIDKTLIIEYFKKFNFDFLGEFNNKYGYSHSTYLIFQKNDR